jgi:hypothetical protein
MRRISFTAGLACLTLTAAPARAALTIVYLSGPAASSSSTMYVDGGHMRVDNPERAERETTVLIDAPGKRFVMLDDKNKTYTEITEEDRKRISAQMQAMRAQMQERMKNMPPEQREKIEARMQEMMGQAGTQKPHEWTFKAMGKKKTVNGFACEMYQVSEDGKPSEEDCISPWSAGVVKKDDFEAIAKFAREMVEELGQGRMHGGGEGIFGRLDKAPGIPITRVPIDSSGQRGEESQVKSIKRGSVSSSLFAIPAGFTKKDLPQMMGPGGPGGGHHRGPPAP